MNCTFCELYPPTAVKDACLAPGFLDGTDALVLAQGNRLAVYPVEDDFLSEPQYYPVYGTISKLVAIEATHSIVSSVLVVLDDLRCCILQVSETDGKLMTRASGSLTPTSDIDVPEVRFASHPTVMVAQIGYKTLQVFPIAPNSTLDVPFPIRIGCRDIIDFAFIGPVSRVTRLAVLTKELDHTVRLRVIDLEPSDRTYTDDTNDKVQLPNDTRSIIAFEPDSQSIVIAFSGQKAIRVAYNVGLTPQVTTATIRTPWPLLKMAAMDRNFYVAIEEESLALRVAKIEEKGTVHFINVATAPSPTALVPVTSKLAFVGSDVQDSVLFAIDQKSQDQMASLLSTITATGPVKDLFVDGKNVYTVFDRAVAETKEMISFRFSLKIECKDCVKHWSFVFNDNPCILITNGTESFVLESKDVIEYAEISDPLFVLDHPTRLFASVGNNYVQVVDNCLRLFSKDAVLDTVERDGLLSASSSGNLLAVATLDSWFLYCVEDKLRLLHNGAIANMCVGIAVCREYVAVATTTEVVWYAVDNGARIKEFSPGPGLIVGMEIDEACDLFVVKSHGDILKVSNGKMQEISCDGDHCGISKYKDSFVVTGRTPYLLRGEKATPIRAANWLSVVEFDELVCGLGSEFLWMGQFSNHELCNRTCGSDNRVLSVYKFGSDYFTARTLGKGTRVGLFRSLSLFANDELTPFFTFSEGEVFIGFASEGDNLFACSSDNILRFIVRGCNVTQAGGQCFGDRVFGFGRFQHYYYFRNHSYIDFCTIDTTNETDCDIFKWFTIDNGAPIVCCDISNQLAAVVGPERTLVVYVFDRFRENFIPISKYTKQYEKICQVCVLDSSIVLCMKSSNVFLLELKSEPGNPASELQLVDSFSVDGAITAIRASPASGDIYIGTDLGSVSRVSLFSPPKRLVELYKVLAQKLCSIGNFSKTLQRSARTGKFYTSKTEICDLEVLKAFKQKPQSEQLQILSSAPSFSLSEALELIDTVL